MAYDLQEQEQLDAIKTWWKDYGGWVSTLLIVTLASYAAWSGWRFYQARQASAARVLYEAVEAKLAANQLPAAVAVKQSLQQQYPKTVYASRATLKVAAAEFNARQLSQASQDLVWVSTQADEPAVQDIAKLRLATVYLDSKQYPQALAQLAAIKDTGIAGNVSVLKGDILVAQGKPAEAKVAYRVALEQLPKENTLRAVIELKSDALGMVK